jgi:hypothetical protein
MFTRLTTPQALYAWNPIHDTLQFLKLSYVFNSCTYHNSLKQCQYFKLLRILICKTRGSRLLEFFVFGKLRLVVSQKFTYVSEVLTAFFIRAMRESGEPFFGLYIAKGMIGNRVAWLSWYDGTYRLPSTQKFTEWDFTFKRQRYEDDCLLGCCAM